MNVAQNNKCGRRRDAPDRIARRGAQKRGLQDRPASLLMPMTKLIDAIAGRLVCVIRTAEILLLVPFTDIFAGRSLNSGSAARQYTTTIVTAIAMVVVMMMVVVFPAAVIAMIAAAAMRATA
jgi:hypothetical protein